MRDPRRQCIASRSTHHAPANPPRCLSPGRVYLGSGRWVCPLHHIHGFIPSDLSEADQVDTRREREQVERMARVASG